MKEKRIIIYNGIIDKFKFWLLGGSREIFYPNRTEYRTRGIISFPLWTRIYIRWFWKYRPSKGRGIGGEQQSELRK